MNYQIIDNFLKKEEFDSLQNKILGADFPWFKNSCVVKSDDNTTIDDRYNWQFTHTFYKDHQPFSHFLTAIDPILNKIQPLALIRIKANLIPCSEKIIEYPFHVDLEKFSGKTAIFYVNSNNGYTLFKDGTKIDSLENRLLVFDANTLHTGSNCTDQRVRCVINFNYFEFEN